VLRRFRRWPRRQGRHPRSRQGVRFTASWLARLGNERARIRLDSQSAAGDLHQSGARGLPAVAPRDGLRSDRLAGWTFRQSPDRRLLPDPGGSGVWSPDQVRSRLRRPSRPRAAQGPATPQEGDAGLGSGRGRARHQQSRHAPQGPALQVLRSPLGPVRDLDVRRRPPRCWGRSSASAMFTGFSLERGAGARTGDGALGVCPGRGRDGAWSGESRTGVRASRRSSGTCRLRCG
jgi:hypothetical protein